MSRALDRKQKRLLRPGALNSTAQVQAIADELFHLVDELGRRIKQELRFQLRYPSVHDGIAGPGKAGA